ncbi:MAG: type VI secretion system tip protein TssI/VgrG [Polyangiales bacterium]
MGFRPLQTRLFSPLAPPVDNGDGTVSDEWFVLKVEGREGLSRLYEVEVTFQSVAALFEPCAEETLEQYLDTNWTLQLVQEVHANEEDGAFEDVSGAVAHAFHGVLREIEMLPINARPGSAVHVGYRAVLVPRLWYATRSVRTRIFQGMSAPEIIAHVLEETGLQRDDDYELRLREPHPMREYTLQYNESDFAFLARLAEYEGIAFGFEQGEDRERVVFADHNDAWQRFEALEPFGMPHVRHDPVAKANHPSIRQLRRTVRKVARSVVALDHDARAPRVCPQDHTEAHERGAGVEQYWLHGKEYTHVDAAPAEDMTAQMMRLTTLRVQAILAARERLEAVSTVLALFSGTRFGLENHFDDSLVWLHRGRGQRREWLVVGARFRVEQDFVSFGRPRDEARLDFEAVLEVQDASLVFRPPLDTPRPVVAGVLPARVHDLVKGPGADLDAAGQYLLMFDIPTIGAPEYGGGTMRRFRMAQTFSGPGYGMHHPLHLGAEVLVAHLAGDPDRPIIVGSPPNGENTSPITQANPTHGGFKTRAGVTVYTNDDA